MKLYLIAATNTLCFCTPRTGHQIRVMQSVVHQAGGINVIDGLEIKHCTLCQHHLGLLVLKPWSLPLPRRGTSSVTITVRDHGLGTCIYKFSVSQIYKTFTRHSQLKRSNYKGDL